MEQYRDVAFNTPLSINYSKARFWLPMGTWLKVGQLIAWEGDPDYGSIKAGVGRITEMVMNRTMARLDVKTEPSEPQMRGWWLWKKLEEPVHYEWHWSWYEDF